VYSYFKYDRKTNYKENLVNSLGVFENPRVFSIVHQVLTTLAHLNGKDIPAAIKSVEDLRAMNEIWKKEKEEIEYAGRKDAANLEELGRLE